MKFDSDGRLVKEVGGEGWGPGQFKTPWALACDEENNLYVVDITAGRVSIFNSAGQFVSSLALSALGFTPVSVAVGSSGKLYVGIFAHSGKPDTPLLYEFSRAGQLVHSFFDQNQIVNTLNLTVVGGVEFDTDTAGDIFAAQPVSPLVSVFSSDGRLIRGFGRIPPFYEPAVKFPNPLPADHSKVSALLARWTQLIDVKVVHTRRIVLLTFNVHSSPPYAIEVYDEQGHLLAGGIGTDLTPAFADERGNVYFSDRSRSDFSLVEATPILPMQGEQSQ